MRRVSHLKIEGGLKIDRAVLIIIQAHISLLLQSPFIMCSVCCIYLLVEAKNL